MSSMSLVCVLQLAPYVYAPTAAGVLQALYEGNDGNLDKIQSLSVDCKLDPVDRRQLTAFLIQVKTSRA